jgi:hypothetical protein
MMTSQQQFLFFRAIPEPNSGCWLWTGSIDRDGYGKFRGALAHRLSFQAFKGTPPNNLTLDHLCRVTSCINPDHLEPVSHKINVLRGMSFSAENARRISCIHGHPFSGDNLYIKSTGKRCCRACWRRRAAAFKARKIGVRT